MVISWPGGRSHYPGTQAAVERRQHRAPVISALFQFRRRLVFSSVALLGLIGFLSTAAIPGASAPAVSTQWTSVHPGDFPDPSVLLYKGVYYGFATQNFTGSS